MNRVLHHIKYTKLLESLLQQPTNHFRQVLVLACIKIFLGAVTADCLAGVIEATPPLVLTPVTTL